MRTGSLTFPKRFVRVPTVALVSGGVESCALIEALLERDASVIPLYVRGGLRWESVELARLKRWLARRRNPRLQPLMIRPLSLRALHAGHWSTTGRGVPSHRSADAAVYLPGRNVWLLTLAATVATQRRCRAVALGTLHGNPFGDATPEFFRAMAAALSQALSHPLQIIAPLRRLAKMQLIQRFPSLPYHLTFSCINPCGTRHCGRCNKCAERQRAFRAAHMPDPTQYAR